MAGNSREFSKLKSREESWARLRESPWSVDERSRAWNSGIPRIQIINCPSFAEGKFFEICELGGSWLLYGSKILSKTFPIRVCGYELLDCADRSLFDYWTRLNAVNLPIAAPLTGTVGLNGATTQLTLFGDNPAQSRFRWWSSYPPAWERLIQITGEMLEVFGKAERKNPL